MSRYIDAEETKKVIRANNWTNPAVPDAVAIIINMMPTADVAPVVHGRWETREGIIRYCCSKCGGYAEVMFRYCHWCGAKMDEEINNETY